MESYVTFMLYTLLFFIVLLGIYYYAQRYLL